MVLPQAARAVISIIPPLLLVFAFAFTLKATLTKDWVSRENWTSGFPSVDEGPAHRSLFTSCGSVHAKTGDGWIEDCHRYMKPGASCFASSTGTDFVSLCQQIKIAGQLIIAAIVFTALALVGTVVLCVSSILYQRPAPVADPSTPAAGSGHHHHHHKNITDADAEENIDTPREPAAATATTTPPTAFASILMYAPIPVRMFAMIAVSAAFLAAMIGGNALVNLQPPNGIFEGASQALSPDANWRLAKGYGFASAAWVVGAFAVWAIDVVWGAPVGGLVL